MLAADRPDAIIAITARRPGRPIPPALAGYPHLTVPMGLANGLPVGLSFIGTAGDEANLLAMGYACEPAAPRRVAPTCAASLNGVPATAWAVAPAK